MKNNYLKNRRLFGASVCMLVLAAGILSSAFLAGCKKKGGSEEQTTILIAAAASLKNTFDDALIPAFKAKNPKIAVQATYDSSGKLQTQIEEGLQADVFMSAALKQMNALVISGFISADSVNNLVQNKLVLIKPAGGTTAVTSFTDINKALSIAIGDPASVPAGLYAQEALTKFGLWESLPQTSKSLGTNVTEVLNWVAQGSAEVGIVYATDAASTKKVEVISVLQDGVLSAPVIYPVGITAKTAHANEAKLFVDFLASKEGLDIFGKYGFAANK
ncbi:MAG: molybdate ABC transporter substrate-binding protein [Termitinemataceae bacterium]|nr:MAG: molybdate ABC transporter substrate-binding protein [Termitinemataceae bacterium]